MKNAIKQLWLVVALIAAASSILLFSDREQRVTDESRQARTYPALAVMQLTSTPLLDDHIAGVFSRLKERGACAPGNRNIRLFNAQGDVSTANAIAREIANGPYELVITSSTVALQTFSKANLTRKKTHVFGAVTDPYGAGVGIEGPEPQQHPPYMAGIGTFQPVRRAIQIAQDMNPALERLGVVWNPGEQCSEACLVQARDICRELGIDLVEAVAANTSEVSEAARSLMTRKPDAVWVGGDTVANASIRLIISLAGEAGIPVFTNDPTDAEKGALFGLGADYFTVGRYTADIAADILEGKSPSAFRIENVIPDMLRLNREVLARLGGRWSLTPSVQALLKEQGGGPDARPAAPEPGRSYHIGLSHFVPAPIFDMAIKGFKDGMRDLGFVEGDNLILSVQHANGDMSFLNQTTADLLLQRPDVLVVMTTACLSSAIAQTEDTNIVFGIVSAPLEGGAGKSFDDHLPNVTGIVQLMPAEELFVWARRLFPEARRIGALYNPSEPNSLKEVDNLKRILDGSRIELVTVAVNHPSEVPEGMRGLLAKGVDLVFAMGDNTIVNAMPAITKACRAEGTPVIAEDVSLMGTGAVLSCAPGPYDYGREIAALTARVLLGESPAGIPFAPCEKNELALDLAAAREAGVTVPVELLERADRFFHVRSSGEAPATVALVNLVENPALDQAIQGVKAALSETGLLDGVDFRMRSYCAQGDMSQLPQILDSVRMDKPDLIVTVSSPVLIAAVQKHFECPLVFTAASDPNELGLFKDGRPGNVCGIHDDPPLGEVLEMVRRHDPGLGAVAIIYDPSQMNALISVKRLRKACEEQRVRILEATASTVSELPVATQAVIDRGARAIVLSADNLVTTGFKAILKVAQAAGVPIYVTDMALIAEGASGGVGDSYFEWGRQSGRLAAKVLAGVPPSRLPVRPTAAHTRVEPAEKAVSRAKTPFKLRLVLYCETYSSEHCRNGLLDGLKKAGLVENRDYALREFNAQGDMSTLSSIMTAVRADRVDLLMAVSTPTLQAALRQAGPETKIVFTGVGDGVSAGAGKSEADHLPNVTGITTRSPFEGMARIVRESLPGIQRAGTLFTPAEVNSVFYKDALAEALEKEGIELVSVPVTSSAEVAQGAVDLCGKDIQALVQIPDNLTRPGFALIARKAGERDLPVYVFDTDQMKEGGVLALARDYYDAGLEAAEIAVRILRGADPKDIAFSNTRSEKLIVNSGLVRRFGLHLSEETMRKATLYPAGDSD
ncbi:ABC transporter substrate-binding protein [Desulfatiglans anilini]|uniref:ABC transporter substrate-binding protein n=1 Tax=Desulfatiglans anilini TaxID=90728 RepID=UPI0004271F83|nr:ABC transporter substrate-binding protein [Desulfatiglans anilini]